MPNLWGKTDLLATSQKSYWHKLLHYRPTSSHGYLSQVDSLDFFVAKNGKNSPEEELVKSLEILDSPQGQDFVCKFPLRYKWLKRQLGQPWKYTLEPCHVYRSFIEKLAAKRVSLVFSSFYINNPGSTFGHTFLRVSRYAEFGTNELLDYAINFAAHETKDNVFFYIIKGLFGFYPGRFSVIPYYYKIREYSDHEFRDIWDYDLNLSLSQTEAVIDHIWELGTAHFDYFYFTENCSYHILGLLNVAYEQVDLLAHLSPLYVLPIDTVKELKRYHLIKEKKVRVSAYGKLLKETKDMGSEEKELVKQMALSPFKVQDFLKSKDENKSAALLDASISALDYLKSDAILRSEKKANEERRQLLLARADNPQISQNLDFSQDMLPAPDDSHNSSRLGFFAGERHEDGGFGGFEWRAAQHELLDPSHGQLRSSQIVIADARVKYQTINFHSSNFILDRLRLIDLKKYQPSDFWNDSIAWDLGLGLDQRRECQSRDCLNPVATFGVGNSVEFFPDYILSILMGGSYQWDHSYQNNSLLNLGPKFNFLVLKEQFSLGLDAGYFLPTELFDGWLKRRVIYNLDVRYFLDRNTSLFFKTANMVLAPGDFHEAQVGLYFYH